MDEDAKEAVAMLRAQIRIWQGDLAHNLKPTEGSLKRAMDRIEVIEKALYGQATGNTAPVCEWPTCIDKNENCRIGLSMPCTIWRPTQPGGAS